MGSTTGGSDARIESAIESSGEIGLAIRGFCAGAAATVGEFRDEIGSIVGKFCSKMGPGSGTGNDIVGSPAG